MAEFQAIRGSFIVSDACRTVAKGIFTAITFVLPRHQRGGSVMPFDFHYKPMMSIVWGKALFYLPVYLHRGCVHGNICQPCFPSSADRQLFDVCVVHGQQKSGQHKAAIEAKAEKDVENSVKKPRFHCWFFLYYVFKSK